MPVRQLLTLNLSPSLQMHSLLGTHVPVAWPCRNLRHRCCPCQKKHTLHTKPRTRGDLINPCLVHSPPLEDAAPLLLQPLALLQLLHLGLRRIDELLDEPQSPSRPPSLFSLLRGVGGDSVSRRKASGMPQRLRNRNHQLKRPPIIIRDQEKRHLPAPSNPLSWMAAGRPPPHQSRGPALQTAGAKSASATPPRAEGAYGLPVF